MRKIPEKTRGEMSKDNFFKRCIITLDWNPEWHHVFKYSGRQINEPWAILPLRKDWHTSAGYAFHKDAHTREVCEYICLQYRATKEDFKKYPKFDWEQRRKYLHKKYWETQPDLMVIRMLENINLSK